MSMNSEAMVAARMQVAATLAAALLQKDATPTQAAELYRACAAALFPERAYEEVDSTPRGLTPGDRSTGT